MRLFTAKPKKATSKYRGVCWSKSKRRWVAQICINGSPQFLGRFFNEIDAAKAFNEAVVKNFGPTAYVNPV